MSELQTIDHSVLELFKLKSTLMDYINATYKPVLKKYIPNDKISDEENVISEEYSRLVFYLKKIKQIVNTLKYSLKDLTEEHIDIRLISNQSDIIKKLDKNVGESLRSVFNYKYFKLFITLASIPSNTEFYYLVQLDTIDLENWISKFDLLFKKYIELVLKKSLIVPE